MNGTWDSFLEQLRSILPKGTPTRNVLRIIGIVLFVEGISVLLLFSYFGATLGILSMVIGGLLLVFLYEREAVESESELPAGQRLIYVISLAVGGKIVFVVVGAAIISFVAIFNRWFSETPSLGDLDTVALLFGGMLCVHPFLTREYKFEADFALLFTGLVFALLVVPQLVLEAGSNSLGGEEGGWYVHYMLAAPFAAILDLIGIPASSSGSLVTIQFNDGTTHLLWISMYCAGLYSFSIFLAAFIAFVLVHERLRSSILAIVLLLGVVIAYIGNLMRMTLIGIVGYYYGMDALMWAHRNAGWMIFLAWSALFWWITLRYVVQRPRSLAESDEAN